MSPPALVLALGTTLITTALSIYALPIANESSRSLLYQMASSKAHAGVRERVFNDDFEGLVIYVERVTPRTFEWENVFISDSRNAAETHTIIARHGMVLSDPQQLIVTLRLKDGAIHKLGDQPSAYQEIDFNNYDLRLNLKTGWKDKQTAEKNPADMSLGELAQAVQALRSKNADAKIQMVKIHEKFSVPFACLVLGIIGIPLGIQSRAGRAGKSMGFVWSIGVLLVYYLLTSAGTSLAERGVVLLEVGMWAANGIFLCLGIYLLVKAANESPVLLLVWLDKGLEFLRQRWGRPHPPKEWKPKE
jgi:lipopolysaccharide export system permease protein